MSATSIYWCFHTLRVSSKGNFIFRRLKELAALKPLPTTWGWGTQTCSRLKRKKPHGPLSPATQGPPMTKMGLNTSLLGLGGDTFSGQGPRDCSRGWRWTAGAGGQMQLLLRAISVLQASISAVSNDSQTDKSHLGQ